MKKFLALLLLACAPTQGPSTAPQPVPRRVAATERLLPRPTAILTASDLTVPDGTAIVVQVKGLGTTSACQTSCNFPCTAQGGKCVVEVPFDPRKDSVLICVLLATDRPCTVPEMSKFEWTTIKVGMPRPRIVGH